MAGGNISEDAWELGSQGSARWLSGVGSNRKPATELEVAVAKLHRKPAVSRMECDLLKKYRCPFVLRYHSTNGHRVICISL